MTAAGIPLDAIAVHSDDSIYDFDIFTNRPDCMNHVGLAREYAALTGAPLRPPGVVIPPGGRPTKEIATVAIEAPDLCARYAARSVLDVRVGPSPDWLRRRLESIGQRSINNIVDATNFVLWELGHPLHPFDLDLLEGRRIVVRPARPGERLRTLDGVERALTGEMLVIADARKPVAMAGIMGGEATQITERTRNVLLESAWFDPVSVRRTARALGLRTDASHRFERGADAEGVVAALDRASQIIAEISGGEITSPALDAHPRPFPPRVIPFRPERARSLLGFGLDDAFMQQALLRLGFGIRAAGDGAWSVTVPSFRGDVDREVDLIEEVARHRGYDAIRAALPVLPGSDEGRSARERTFQEARRAAQAAGLSEAINYTMVEPDDCLRFDPDVSTPVALTNPLQENATCLRTSLLPGLLRNLARNFNHGLEAVRLFEAGTTFHPAAPLPQERQRLAFVMAGRGLPAHWSLPRREVDLYDARGAVELLGDLLGVSPLVFSSDRISFLEEGRALRAVSGGRPLGVVGTIRRSLLESYGVDRPVHAGEIELDALVQAHGGVRRYRPLPRYPGVRRDLAIVTAPGTTFEAIDRVIRRASRLPIAEVQIFDLYRGPGVPAGCASLAVQIVFQHAERTLTAQEAQESIEAITAALSRELQAKLRGAESR
ncbi:MAG: phenylalanine--tRNA ligase subunit beta [Acidobacteria bacterium 13_1_40CM_4_69_4]|nr:MAG: phenylalanine--tRNA ligase subunit beta [Acidobacteria bacterium 13_1_40CM_4_69_4]